MPAMPRAHGNGVELEYETVGDPAGRPLLLVQGLGAQLTSVEDGLCQELAGRGFLVIRYDNRDVGLSTWFDHARPVNLAAVWGGDHSSLAYTLEDMADDAVAVLDAAGVEAAYGDRLKRLTALKDRYDPANLFRHNQNIAPAEQVPGAGRGRRRQVDGGPQRLRLVDDRVVAIARIRVRAEPFGTAAAAAFALDRAEHVRQIARVVTGAREDLRAEDVGLGFVLGPAIGGITSNRPPRF